tara:strand:+ start:154 stop:606 length:453 start_codon:yes stop_codon:yes gene_type:complete
MPIKTFRGLIGDGAQDTIVLHTNDGSTGYRIVKFQIMVKEPGNVAQESVVQMWKVKQTTVVTTNATIDFSDNTLLGAAVGIYGGLGGNTVPFLESIIFDNEIFNQDIYITHTDNESAESINYYLELEQVKLDLSENTVATLKDIRNITAQ